ncbi:MAG TPA: 50S ribosomal protein L11, partial [Devosia sp.]|nr:50S ribosomal protein L11 [Devosia sp.]
GAPVPCIITIYADKSFSFEMKMPPVSYMIKQAVKVKSGSKKPGHENAGTLSLAQVRSIAEAKMKDLNAHDIEAAMAQIAGSARSMGIEIGG